MNGKKYEILGVKESDSAETIKKAYLKMCKKYHPDLAGGAAVNEEIFKLISQAYSEILEDKSTGGAGERRQEEGATGIGKAAIWAAVKEGAIQGAFLFYSTLMFGLRILRLILLNILRKVLK